jgi:hypothetical protein
MESIHTTSFLTWALRLLELSFVIVYVIGGVEFRIFEILSRDTVPLGILLWGGLVSILIGSCISWTRIDNGGGWWMVVGAIAMGLALGGAEGMLLIVPFVTVPFVCIGLLVCIDSWVERHNYPQFDGMEGGWGGPDVRPDHKYHLK